MNVFLSQIKEDMNDIKRTYSYLDARLVDDNFCFNYWILAKLYNIDEEMVSSYMIENEGNGVDCYVRYEEIKELHIIQNKFYSTNTTIKSSDIADYLHNTIRDLDSGKYNKNLELQKIFYEIKEDDEYKIFFYLYITNDNNDAEIARIVKSFTYEDIKANCQAMYCSLSEIAHKYYDDRFSNKVKFNCILNAVNDGVVLKVLPESYDLPLKIESRYILTRIVDLYAVYKKAKEQNYRLFDDNIREFLGTRGVNNKMIKTLQNKNERRNFFYYNNGVTIICEKIEKVGNAKAGGVLYQPQIINGCQTVNSIAYVIENEIEVDKIEEKYGDIYVLVKVFVVNRELAENEELVNNIIRYTNSQSNISKKHFGSKNAHFLNMQKDLLDKGFLLEVKPSDKNKFKEEYGKTTGIKRKNELLIKSNHWFEKFDISQVDLKDISISLEKLLKAILAFDYDGETAFNDGSKVTKEGTEIYKNFSLKVREFYNTDIIIGLYLMYLKAEKARQEVNVGVINMGGRSPIPYYILGFMGYVLKRHSCYGKEYVNEKLRKLFSNEKIIREVYEIFKYMSNKYAKDKQKQGIEYNVMIKQKIDTALLESIIDGVVDMPSVSENVMWFMSEEI